MKSERAKIELNFVKREFIKFGIGRHYVQDGTDNIGLVVSHGLHPHDGLTNLEQRHVAVELIRPAQQKM